MTRERKALIVLLGVLAVAGLFGLRLALMVRRGEEVFWLAELWTPAALLSMGLVTCAEFLLPHRDAKAGKDGPAKRAPRSRPRKKG